VIKFLKNRSQWFAVHEVDELRQMKNVPFSVVHHASPFQELVTLFENGRLNGEKFLMRCEELRKTHAARDQHLIRISK
jgi:hypothetical protein